MVSDQVEKNKKDQLRHWFEWLRNVQKYPSEVIIQKVNKVYHALLVSITPYIKNKGYSTKI